MRTSRSVAGLQTAVVLSAFCFTATQAQQVLIEEILVTAQKREQNMQDVPVAVTAYSGRMLEESGIKDIRELSAIAPALQSNQSQTSTTSSFSIRGIGTSAQNFGLESSVGLYIDGVYRARQSSIINNLVDVQAVEVLRGPQGTLFGKNTPSGAITMTTVRPGHERNAFFEVTAGDYGLVNLAAASNFSLIDDVLALRATVFSGERDGFVSDVALGSDEINDRSRAGGRLQLYYTPNDQLDVRVVADYGEINETCCAALTRQSNLTAFGRDNGMGGPVFGSDALLTMLGGTVFPGTEFDNHTTALNRLPHSSNNDGGLSVELNYDFENVTLTSISAYREFTSYDRIDADFSNVDLLTDTNSSEQNSFSQELRLTGEIGDRTTYVAGVYYFQQDLDNLSTLNMGSATSPFLSADPLLNQVITSINLFSPPFPPVATAFPASAFATDDMRQEHESYAIFAQADFELSENWLLTAGLRYTDEEKTMVGRFTNSQMGPPPDFTEIVTVLTLIQMGLLNPMDPANAPRLQAAFGPTWVPGWGLYTQPALAPQAGLNETLADDQVTGTIKLSWFANDTTMLYASFGTGYKSGGTNTDRINPIFSQTFGPETSAAFEVGVKADFPDQNLRLNLALHNTQVEDLQTNAFSGNGFNLQNAGNADTYGGELELWWNPSETLQIQANYVLSIADFDKFRNGTCWRATPFHTGTVDPGFDPSSGPFSPTASVCDRTGGRVPSNPENSFFLAVNKSFNIGSSTSVFLRGEYAYMSDVMTDGNNDPLKLRPSFDNLNLKLGFLFDNIDSELSIWGRNVTDERFYETVFDVPVQDGKLNAYPHEPRTWGVTFRKSFQ
jgi:iron complex outermembrane recepter protein